MASPCALVLLSVILLFFFNDTATTEIYTLSLHDALPSSSLLILECDARMTWPASSSEIRFDSRSRRSCAPSSRRSTVGPPPPGGSSRLRTWPPPGSAVIMCTPQNTRPRQSPTSAAIAPHCALTFHNGMFCPTRRLTGRPAEIAILGD